MYLKVNIEAINDGMLVPVTRKTASRILRQLEADQGTIDRMKLVITEACTNVVRHAYDRPALYEVGLEYNVDMVMITVKDYGRGFDVKELPVPIHGMPQAGGYGISFMKKDSSNIIIESTPEDGTTVKIEIPVTYHNKQAESKIKELPSL
ncbi:MAG: ATP-binding protein [Armatimonadota bacterium]